MELINNTTKTLKDDLDEWCDTIRYRNCQLC